MEIQPRNKKRSRSPAGPIYVVEFFEGLGQEVGEELAGIDEIRIVKEAKAEITVEYSGDPADLTGLRLAGAVYRSLYFGVPRPKALLGHQHFQRLIGEIEALIGRFPEGTFNTLHLSAAGRDSAVLQRLIAELAGLLGLTADDRSGDLFLRVRRAQPGWEVLSRLTPRPLTTRTWRKVDLAGALSGPLAAAMVDLAEIGPDERYFNLLCGSGTLLVEQGLSANHPRVRLGGDLDPAALAAAGANLRGGQVVADLCLLDAVKLPLADQSVDVVTADLPWGQLVGSSQTNDILYPGLLDEVARITRPAGRFIAITHDIRRFEDELDRRTGVWRQEQLFKLKIGQLRPRIYRLRRQ